MKNKLFLLFTVSFLEIVLLHPLLIQGFYSSHDGENHLIRFGAYAKAFHDGHFPPRWAGDLNFGFGSPVFIFFYPLSGYIASFIHSLGLNLETTFKLIIATAFIGCFVTFYMWASQLFTKKVAILSAFLYMILPYHLLDIYIRGDIGELIALCFAPLVFFFIEKNQKNLSISFITLGGISYGLLILSHNAISLMFSGVFLAYIFIHSKKPIVIGTSIMMLIIGLGLSSYFWIPVLLESKYVSAHLFIGSMYKNHFPTFFQLIYSPWGFGADVFIKGGLSPQIGLLYILGAILGVVTSLRKKIAQKEVIFWSIVGICAIFLTTSFSVWLWEKLPTLQLFQFPWRFVAVSSFAAVVLTAYFLKNISNSRILISIGAFFLISILPFIKVDKFISRPDSYYSNHTGTTYYHGEASSIWTAGDAYEFPKNKFEVIAGDASITSMSRKTNHHQIVVNAKNESRILDNTVYFPGWTVLIDGKKTLIEFQDINHRGLITFSVPTGKHTVDILFKESGIRLVSDFISLSFLVLIVFMYLARNSLEKIVSKK